MSYILEALKKSQRDRELGQVPTLASEPFTEPHGQQRNYNLGGTYGIALSADGSQLFVSFNGAELPAGRQSEFGLCSALLLHIPESERNEP